MSYLEAIVDHPIALIISLILSAPFVWFLARIFFLNIAEEMEEAAPYFLINALPGPDFITWPHVKLILVLFFSAAVVTLFYRICAWFAS